MIGGDDKEESESFMSYRSTYMHRVSFSARVRAWSRLGSPVSVPHSVKALNRSVSILRFLSFIYFAGTVWSTAHRAFYSVWAIQIGACANQHFALRLCVCAGWF